MATSERINNFSSLVECNFYKVIEVEPFESDYTPNQVIYTLINGQRLFGRPGINEFFRDCRAPFFFQFRGQSDSELFKSYKFNIYKDVEELVSENYREIEQIMADYITSKACTGCIERQPNQMAHMCVIETRIEQAKQYLTIALDEHPKYDVADIVDAFEDFRTLLLP